EEQRQAHGVPAAWRWARRIADGLDACRNATPLEPRIYAETEARAHRDEVWKALLPTAFARPLRGISPELVLPLRRELEAEGVAAWQMHIAYARDRVYPAGAHELFGDWGYVDPTAAQPRPRTGLERLCDRFLSEQSCALLEHQPERYRWIDDRPVRGVR